MFFCIWGDLCHTKFQMTVNCDQCRRSLCLKAFFSCRNVATSCFTTIYTMARMAFTQWLKMTFTTIHMNTSTQMKRSMYIYIVRVFCCRLNDERELRGSFAFGFGRIWPNLNESQNIDPLRYRSAFAHNSTITYEDIWRKKRDDSASHESGISRERVRPMSPPPWVQDRWVSRP